MCAAIDLNIFLRVFNLVTETMNYRPTVARPVSLFILEKLS